MRSRSLASGDPDEDVSIPAGGVVLGGHLHVPASASALVIFAHASGSSRFSPRNAFVASVLFEAGIGNPCCLDLLTAAEERDRQRVFDVPLLAGRLVATTRWARERAGPAHCRIRFFGGARRPRAALFAAAELGDEVSAVVSRAAALTWPVTGSARSGRRPCCSSAAPTHRCWS